MGGVGFLSNIVQVVTGGNHTCAVDDDGDVYCWGLNALGQLGDGTTTNRTNPVEVLNEDGSDTLGDISSLTAGSVHTCALDSTRKAYCWGHNAMGALGNDTTTDSALPVDVVGEDDEGLLRL